MPALDSAGMEMANQISLAENVGRGNGEPNFMGKKCRTFQSMHDGLDYRKCASGKWTEMVKD